jgi:hypothetical protein
MAINLDDLQPYVVTPDPADKIWLFYGEMATRKTSVACQFPDSLLIAFDIGYKFIVGGKQIAAPIETWVDFKSIVKQLDQPKNKKRFKTVIIDTIGMAYNACYQYMLTQMGIEDPGEKAFGMGWKKIRLEFERVVRSIAQKGYGLIMLAHSDEVEKEDKITKNKVLVTKIDIDKRPDLIIKQLADFVLYLHKEPRDGTEEPSVYAYSNLIEIETKTRSKYLTPRFEFTYENLIKELSKSVAKQYEEAGIEMPTDVISQNPFFVAQEDFAVLRDEVVKLANELVEHGYEQQVTTLLLDVFKGQRVSELDESEFNIDKLSVVKATLTDLKSKAKL